MKMLIRSLFPGNLINVVFDGNSITAGQGVTVAQRYGGVVLADSSLLKYWGPIQRNIGVGGQTTVDMIGRQAVYLFPYKEARCKRNLVIAMEVRNDLQLGETDANALANIKTYCQNCKDQGFDVILINQPPSTGGTPTGRTQAEMETSRLWVRSQILTDFPNSTAYSQVYAPANGITYADIVCDIGDPSTIMGDVLNCSDLTKYQDGTHPTATGQSLMAVPIKSAIQYYLSIAR